MVTQPFCTCYNDTGLFGVYVVSKGDKDTFADLTHHIQEETVQLTTGVSSDDLERAKANLKFNLLQQLDGTSPTAEEIGRQMLTYGRRSAPTRTESSHHPHHRRPPHHHRLTPLHPTSHHPTLHAARPSSLGLPNMAVSLPETFARIDDISEADIGRVAEKVIWDQEIAIAAIGPNLKYLGDLNYFRRGTYWQRL